MSFTKITAAFVQKVRVMSNKKAVIRVFPLAKLEQIKVWATGSPQLAWSFTSGTDADEDFTEFVTNKSTDDTWRRAKIQVVRWLQENIGHELNDQTGELVEIVKTAKVAKVAKDVKFDTDPSAISPTLFAVDLLNAMGARKAVQLLNPKVKIKWENPKAKEGTSLGACTMHVFGLAESVDFLMADGRWIEAVNEQTLYNRAWAFIRGQILAFGMAYFDELVQYEKMLEEDGEEGEGDDDSGWQTRPATTPEDFYAAGLLTRSQYEAAVKEEAEKKEQLGEMPNRIPGVVISEVLRISEKYRDMDREGLLGRVIQLELQAAKAS